MVGFWFGITIYTPICTPIKIAVPQNWVEGIFLGTPCIRYKNIYGRLHQLEIYSEETVAPYGLWTIDNYILLKIKTTGFSHEAFYLSCILINLSFWQFYPFNPTLVSFQTTRLHNTSVYVFVLKPVLPENDRQRKGKSSNRLYYIHQEVMFSPLIICLSVSLSVARISQNVLDRFSCTL